MPECPLSSRHRRPPPPPSSTTTPACAAAHALRLGRPAHGDAVRFALSQDGYSQNWLFAGVVALFSTMASQGVSPNEISLISFLPCLQGEEWLPYGKMVHGHQPSINSSKLLTVQKHFGIIDSSSRPQAPTPWITGANLHTFLELEVTG
ncbi:hypothetical protein ACP4OV_015123 [Aristida adscensionis]